LGEFVKRVIFLQRNDILYINKIQISLFGGLYSSYNDNVMNDGFLKYLLEAIEEEMFGKPICRDVYEAAMFYTYHIIKDHIFNDGCKRTGIQSALLFLEKNGLSLKEDATSHLKEFTISIEKNQITKSQIVAWIKKNTV